MKITNRILIMLLIVTFSISFVKCDSGDRIASKFEQISEDTWECEDDQCINDILTQLIAVTKEYDEKNDISKENIDRIYIAFQTIIQYMTFKNIENSDTEELLFKIYRTLEKKRRNLN